MDIIERTQYRTRFYTRKNPAKYCMETCTVHARPFRGHPAYTVRVIEIAAVKCSGRWRVDVRHEHDPNGWTIAGRQVYDDCRIRWWGRWHGKPRVQAYRKMPLSD